ncbi:TrkH family potassium uptake protein [Peribacillus kribbensis]|uniref:TrkH family potassium uptake protein n=1 Tax=Peribacillus kribbensis TaxID=356658 RepID=UPI00040D84AA|nr:potassium transporter TrkG [Peribacillus kribbensis]
MAETRSNIKAFRLVFIFYLTTILLFTLIYLLPISHLSRIGVIDSVFVSTSALSVTGLSTIDISRSLSVFGQIILMIEMQLGGIGILVVMSYLFLMLGKRLTMSNLLLLSKDQNQSNLRNIRSLAFSVLLIALLFEFVCFLVSLFVLLPHYTNVSHAVFLALFHSVASFTNSGFDLFGNGLLSYQKSKWFVLTTAFTIFFGSLGYPTIMEYVFSFKKKKSLFTRINIRMHFGLLAAGALLFFLLEYGHALQRLNLMDKFTNSIFLSATARNGGLSTLPLSSVTMTSLMILMFLMFIGGASSSAGGGIRLTTFRVLIAKTASVAKSQEHTVIKKKNIAEETINKSFLIFFSFSMLLFIAAVILSMLEKQPMEAIIFEVLSALTNTGLSLGITSELSSVSKIVLILLMIIGRIGIFSMIYSVLKLKASRTRYLKEDLAVG